MERVLRTRSNVRRRVRDVFKSHKFLISKKRSVATRKFYGTCFSEEMLLLDKKESHCPIRQILKLIAPLAFPFSILLRRGGIPLVFHRFIGGFLRVKLSHTTVWAGRCVLQLTTSWEASRGRGTWKRTSRVNLYYSG